MSSNIKDNLGILFNTSMELVGNEYSVKQFAIHHSKTQITGQTDLIHLSLNNINPTILILTSFLKHKIVI